jgi:multidrug resistance efflux pump
MTMSMLVIYAVGCYLLFKHGIIKPRPFPIAIAIAVGGLAVGTIVVTWLLVAPMSGQAVTQQLVVQLVPYVKGQVLKIHAKPGEPLKKGDLLLEIDPATYQYTVNQCESQLNAAKETVNQARAALQAAGANVVKAKSGVSQATAAENQAKAAVVSAQASLTKVKAQDDLARTEEQIALNLQRTDAGAISALKVTQATQQRAEAAAAVKQAEAAVAEATAAEQQAHAGLGVAQSAELQADAAQQQAAFALKVAEANVPAVQAQLDDARFNLNQCKMLAPADGYVYDWVIQDGSMVIPYTVAAAGVFISTEETNVIASFPQNYLMNVEPGDEVEMIFDPYPGRLFKGKLDYVIPVTGEGEFLPNKQIPYAAKIGSYGMLAVRISLSEDDKRTKIPMGAGGTVAIYTKSVKPIQVFSRVALRMKKWTLYVTPSVSKP